MTEKRKTKNADLNLSPKEKSICPVIAKGKTKLSRTQSEYNRLTRKITALKEDIEELPMREKVILAFYEEKARSLFEKESQLKFDYLNYLDSVYETAKLTVKDRDTLIQLILTESEVGDSSFIKKEIRDRISEVRDKYEGISTGLSREEREQEEIRDILDMCQDFGLKLNAKMKKAKSIEELNDALLDFISSEFEKEVLKEEKKKNKKQPEEPKRRLTKGEIAQKIQEEQNMKSLRDIYIELVKELHPDRETDEELRQLKEERMKQLTEAYKSKDLASLLSMQVNWLEETLHDPGSQNDEVLKRYNKVLGSQLERLEEEYYLLCNAPFVAVEGAYADLRRVPLKNMKKELNLMYQMQEDLLVDVKEYIDSVSTLTGLKRFLKKYAKKLKTEEEMEESLLDYFFGGVDDFEKIWK